MMDCAAAERPESELVFTGNKGRLFGDAKRVPLVAASKL